MTAVYERHTLSNGLRVLTAPLAHAQSVACYIMLAAGSRYENAGNRGIAHFAEHMFFKGTETASDCARHAMEVDKIGGEFNAFTSKEYTGYYIRCAGEQRDVALDVLVDMLRNSKFDAEELEREKGVIIEEMNMYFDTPRDYVVVGLRGAALRVESTRLGDARHEGDDQGDDARDVPRLPRSTGTRRSAWSSASAGMIGDDLLPTLEEPARRHRPATAPAQPAPAPVERSSEPKVRIHRKDSDQANVCSRRPQLSDRPSRPVRAAAARHRARHRHVVAPLPRGA